MTKAHLLVTSLFPQVGSPMANGYGGRGNAYDHRSAVPKDCNGDKLYNVPVFLDAVSINKQGYFESFTR